MKSFFSIVQHIVFLVLLVFIQFAVSYVLPFPLSAMHVPTVIIVVYLFVKEKRHIVWYMFGLFFLLEILVPSSLFGDMLVPGVLSAFVVYWCHRFLFTNQSLYTAMLLGAITLLSYRVMTVVYDVIVGVLTKHDSLVLPSWSLQVFGIEFLVTQLVLLSLIFFLQRRKKTY
ncbi:MAG: hypothetical protein CO030_03845 [Candidatus Magasanikbacteria bacterium CG_4_9_14_0_2_um_filter_42_11]|uniref:Rod shape-determining protein MreD n=1 Tax=Candidatus Magasanikbacteria bacterium CG_4_9_14_0_2_um_filter_42_11 TaxID=1974643 RepID=A0A2M8F8Z7_9BACT|nr:MAG: hypothetical protein COU34_03550 [Candidatus Magasanikbacteria bacterium CG10_big_fil_rev_8_21_14_0_10_43_9]PIY92665.1 MAG: hypothetical protein COY70_02115 [Candidatus Magasanikbacteria bacterium CG_4_10_14_0_8_um_filter_42_12]PJC52225.1 MAG: hypothetical protein CO030_03845 [Candidatus Magasanikbacteria bacterium CG_4_9_14_0_2_um_filter_42_11]